MNFLLLINYHDFLYKNAQIPKQSHTFRVLNMAHNNLRAAATTLRKKLNCVNRLKGMNLLGGCPVIKGQESSAFRVISDHVSATITEYGQFSPEGVAVVLNLLIVAEAWLAFVKARDDANNECAHA